MLSLSSKWVSSRDMVISVFYSDMDTAMIGQCLKVSKIQTAKGVHDLF